MATPDTSMLRATSVMRAIVRGVWLVVADCVRMDLHRYREPLSRAYQRREMVMHTVRLRVGRVGEADRPEGRHRGARLLGPHEKVDVLAGPESWLRIDVEREDRSLQHDTLDAASAQGTDDVHQRGGVDATGFAVTQG